MTRHSQRGNLTTEIALAHERITQLSSKLEMANNTICEYEQKAQWLESLENQLASMQSLATVGTEEHTTAQAALAVRLEAQVLSCTCNQIKYSRGRARCRSSSGNWK